MSRTWKQVGTTALLFTLLLACQGQADEKRSDKPAEPTIADLSLQLKEISTQLKQINERLKDVEGKKVDVLDFKKLVSDFQMLADEVKALRGQVENLQTSYRDLADKVKAQDERLRIARSPSEPRPGGPAGGTVWLQNRSGLPATVTIDGTAYSLDPYETRQIDRPFGTVTYSVDVGNFGRLRTGVTRVLSPEEPYLGITITPPSR